MLGAAVGADVGSPVVGVGVVAGAPDPDPPTGGGGGAFVPVALVGGGTVWLRLIVRAAVGA